MKGRGWKPSLVSQGRRDVVLAVRVRDEELRALRTGVPPSLASSLENQRRRTDVASVAGLFLEPSHTEKWKLERREERGKE